MQEKLYIFRMNTKVIYGNNFVNRISQCVQELNGKKILIVTDPGIEKAGILQKLTLPLEQSGYTYVIYSNVIPNPDIPTIEKGAVLARENEVDLIIAIGGGSAIDAAKGINILYTNGGNLKDYAGMEKVPKKALPLIAIPTTCGTGSEVTWATVITDPVEKFKFAVLSPQNIPNIAIIDPLLMSSLPPRLIASTGMDALTHAIEAYVSVKAQPMSDAFGLHAIELISENLRKAVLHHDNLENISKMAIASTMAGAAFSNGLLGLVHAMAHPLGGVFNIPHGIANAVLLPYVMKFNMTAAPERFAKIAQLMGENIQGLNTLECAKKSLDAVLKLSADIGIPNNLKDIGVDLSLLDKLAADTMKSGNVFSNPRRNNIDDVKNIFIEAYDGRI
ncbi:MAG: iron-containing alcohol dehydrogenase [Bacillota bacterium]